LVTWTDGETLESPPGDVELRVHRYDAEQRVWSSRTLPTTTRYRATSRPDGLWVVPGVVDAAPSLVFDGHDGRMQRVQL
jgi:hypothetical protein